MAEDLVCIDISHWQSTVDFAQVKAGGVLGVILKATEGTGYRDQTFRSRYQEAKNEGLAVAAYHFFKPGNPTGQMDFFLDTVQPEPGERLVIDYEDPDCDLDDLKEAALYLSDLGYQVTIYGANGFLGAQLGGVADPDLGIYDLWVASYTSKEEPTTSELEATWPQWNLWQYTDSAVVEGVVGPCDGNRFFGTPEEFLVWMAPTGARPRPKPVPEELPVVTLTVESEMPVRLRLLLSENVTLGDWPQ